MALHPNFPNPFNPSTVIGYQLPEAGSVSIQVYDVTGRLVATLVDGMVNAGRHQVRFDAGSLSSGVYIVRMQTSGFLQTQKMILLK
jgi:flagellar hook assembly protein FlgD